jgi:3-hydroxyacyl-CoA dehydrogenase-like protein
VLASISHDLGRQVAKGQLSEAERETALARLALTSSYREFADCDVIIEAATEDEDVKRQIFAALGSVLKPRPLSAPPPRPLRSHISRRTRIVRDDSSASTSCIPSRPWNWLS